VGTAYPGADLSIFVYSWAWSTSGAEPGCSAL